MLDDKELISLLYQVIARDSLKLASVSADLGTAPETISRWKKSGKLGRSNRDLLAIWLASKGIDLDAELLKRTMQKRPGDCSFDVPAPVFVPLLTVAQAASVQASAFGPAAQNIEEGSQSGFMNPKPGDFAIVVSGRSMLPWYPPGTHILVFELLSINSRDGLPPIRLNKMDRTEWYWCWPIKESKRNERDLDNAMKEFGIHHFWEDRVTESMKKEE